jgi:A/G-specific adenine glycosylase
MKSIRRDLLAWYGRYGRFDLPWRVVRDPYYTLVSEFMLQQTQVDRVVPKFNEFIDRFPTVQSLAAASAGDVLRLWQGLGYNSRAVRLVGVAVAVCERFDGTIPRDLEALRSLPGIGPYTAAAIAAFGYDERVAPIDTNVRRVVHRLFFGLEHPPIASSGELDERANALVPEEGGHDWSSAMMDLGATVCTARAPKCLICPLQPHCEAAPIDPSSLDGLRRKHAKKASPQNAIPFEATTRFARGRIVDRLRALAPGERISLLDLHHDLQAVLRERTLKDVEELVAILERDGLVACDGANVGLRE